MEEKNFLFFRISNLGFNLHMRMRNGDEIMSENELCLRMQKTTAQTQSIKRAVKHTPTLTISIPDIGAIEDVDRNCQSRAEREHLLARLG